MARSTESDRVPPISPRVASLLQAEAGREPVRYTGELQPDPACYDGGLPHAVGVHHVQVYRATRSANDGTRGTYNHQPYLVWWRGRFHLHFLSARRAEHEAPTLTFWCSSADGYHWSAPEVAFPEYRLPAFQLEGTAYPAGLSAVMHQRMGFYVAPNGRLLMLGFYGICPDTNHSPNAGNGVGRVVREIRSDSTPGEIHFIRCNRHAGFDERNTSFPFFTSSPDAGFREACEALLADKLATLQWWEEDRANDGFFAIDPSAVADAPVFNARMVTSAGAGKAFTWFTRADGVVVGLWKNQFSALSPDRGRTWTPIVRNTSLRTTGAKIWGQRTSDGRYALVYNHSATRANRFPISALVGDDGRDFPELLCLGGEVPPRRYAGRHRGPGMHYFRGISEGSAQPPGGDLWVAFSVNKEDIWILRARVPLTGVETLPVPRGEIAAAATIADLPRWNFHLPRWATTRIAADPATGRSVLELRDEDPWDYALAERVFPAAARLRVTFRVWIERMPDEGSFEFELQSQRHDRPVRLRVTSKGLHCEAAPGMQHNFAPAKWHAVKLECDCEARTFAVSVDGVTVLASGSFAEPAAVLERIVFRTGPWRGRVPAELLDGSAARHIDEPGKDLGADEPVAPTIVRIDDLFTEEL
jgi:hypothetical protein